jgi:hypothetical protein
MFSLAWSEMAKGDKVTIDQYCKIAANFRASIELTLKERKLLTIFFFQMVPAGLQPGF